MVGVMPLGNVNYLIRLLFATYVHSKRDVMGNASWQWQSASFGVVIAWRFNLLSTNDTPVDQ